MYFPCRSYQLVSNSVHNCIHMYMYSTVNTCTICVAGYLCMVKYFVCAIGLRNIELRVHTLSESPP